MFKVANGDDYQRGGDNDRDLDDAAPQALGYAAR
jgi:hypothetical protein